MALIYNGTTIPTNGDFIKYNGTNLTQVDVKESASASPVTVWKKETDWYPDCSTLNWSTTIRDSYMVSNTESYGYSSEGTKSITTNSFSSICNTQSARGQAGSDASFRLRFTVGVSIRIPEGKSFNRASCSFFINTGNLGISSNVKITLTSGTNMTTTYSTSGNIVGYITGNAIGFSVMYEYSAFDGYTCSGLGITLYNIRLYNQ